MSDPAATTDAEGSVRVVGTAHVSPESVGEVEETIREERPDVVAVELDEGRFRQLKGEEPDDLAAGDLLRGNTVFQFLAYWMLSYVQTRLGDEFDITPGADMLAGVETAEELGLGLALVDRDIQMTVQRFWARMTAGEKFSMLLSLPLAFASPIAVGLGIGLSLGVILGIPVEAFFGPLVVPPALAIPGLVVSVLDYVLVTIVLGLGLAAVLSLAFVWSLPEEDEVEEFDIADMTDTDVVSTMLEEFRQFSPGGAEALIDERDAFIAHRLVALRASGHRVVAVLGAGHMEGVERYLENPETLPPMESLVGRETGRRFSAYKVVGYLITLGFLAFFVLLAMAGARNEFLLTLFGAWFLINGVFSATLARLGGAHWTSALVGGAVAWLTSVNPLLAPGWFAGYVELRYLDVNVGDIGTLNEILSDEETPMGELWTQLKAVGLFRLIAVVALTNVGSIVASFLFAAVVLPILASGVGGVGGVADLMVEGARNSADLIWGTVT
ncbi:TraB/GumN family protein [Halococcus sp. IIIV-5B]|uniref:TraB/GumN family protein n=1 Tax=Halococcus sp. IIIV-5B TaxID=2321230 RepID=UPI000E719DCB|nr:TraB/GumN family protein [Halococcus sp. IIIV-5B]RJT02192.1 TraB/GumN family protein [Halococcus sp. IIIV-5B]